MIFKNLQIGLQTWFTFTKVSDDFYTFNRPWVHIIDQTSIWIIWYGMTKPYMFFFNKSRKSAFPLKWNWSKEKRIMMYQIFKAFLFEIKLMFYLFFSPEHCKMPIQSMNKQSKIIDIGTVTIAIDYLPFTSVLSINIVRHWY